MRERLPIWFQCLALLCLVAVWIAVLSWVGPWRWRVGDIVHSYIPLALLYLAVRFAWRFGIRRQVARRTATEAVFYAIGVFVMIALFVAILLQPAIQRVRDASGSLVAHARSMSQ